MSLELNELQRELSETIKTLEAEIPANPSAEKNESIEKGLTKSLKNYFKHLNDAVDWNELELIYYRHAGISESDRPVKPSKPIKESNTPEVVTVKGEKGDKGDKGDRGEPGGRGEQGLSGAKGDKGLKGDKGERGERGEQGISGERGERGLTGKQGEQGKRGEKGDTGDPGLDKKQQTDIKKLIKDFSDKKFVEDNDPRLKDKREPKEHKHPEIAPVIMSYPVMNVGGISGGIKSEAPAGYLEVTNVYYDPETEKMVVVYKGE